MHVTINTKNVLAGTTPISDEALALVRGKPNPSKLPAVDRMKALAAALISECEAIRDARGPGAREAAIAITQIQGACMFAVSAATAEV